MPASARVWRRAELSVGQRAEVEFAIDAEQMAAFAALSGDYNPLHTDGAFAQAQGFAGPVVYGALLVAKVSRLIGMELPGRDSVWSSVALRFHAPLLVGETARVSGEIVALSAATGLLELKLALHAGARLLAKGKAEVLLVER